jgi:4-hydroxythreonine-4-phosphate dehydrogenase
LVRPLALTPGEPAGIGPDIALELLHTGLTTSVVLVADRELLEDRADGLGFDLEFADAADPKSAQGAGVVRVLNVPCRAPVISGVLNTANSPYVLETLDAALEGIRDGVFSGLVTGPVHKGIINDAGMAFTGHTEYLAQATGGTPVMMLVAPSLRVALATTHVPLKGVVDALSASVVEHVIRTIDADLRSRFRVNAPRILVCGVNPHAGEAGHLGREEIEWLNPLVEQLRNEGFDLDGPRPADTAFVPMHRERADVVLAMYHDQGLPVLKALGFGDAVNVTLGLPIIRTSVDHGTAIDLAGSGEADPSSLRAAVSLAAKLAGQEEGAS